MSNPIDLVIALLGLFGGAALGAAAGGGIAAAGRMQGGALAALVGCCAVLGGGVGAVVIGGVKLPDFGALAAKAAGERPKGGSDSKARLLAVLKDHYPDEYIQAQATTAQLTAAHAS